MSTTRPKSQPDPRQMRLGFEPTNKRGQRWCATCQVWVVEALYDLFHGWGHPRRPVATEPAKPPDSSG